MKSRVRLAFTSAALACVIVLAGCSAASDDRSLPADGPAPVTESSQPSGSAEGQGTFDLFDEITTADYTRWTPAPGYESRVAAKGPHGDEVRILLDPTAKQGLAAGGGQWPMNSVIVKDIYQNGALVQIAAMKKTTDGWYWGEWDARGRPVVEGLAAEPCEGCHASGTDGTLGVALK